MSENKLIAIIAVSLFLSMAVCGVSRDRADADIEKARIDAHMCRDRWGVWSMCGQAEK